MSTVHEKLADNFFRWEGRGRGTLTFEEVVSPEPPFVPFPGHRLIAPPSATTDHGLKPTFLSKLVARLSDTLHPAPGQSLTLSEDSGTDEELAPTWLSDEGLPVQELRILLPPDQSVSAEAMEYFLSAVSLAASPLTLELIGTASQSWLQLVAHDDDLVPVNSQLKAHFPDFVTQASEGELDAAWGPLDDESERLVIEFALAHPFMMPLASPGKSDPFVGWLGALSTLNDDEAAIYQVIFTPITEAWSENIIAAVTKSDGKPFFDDGADLVKAAQAKIAQPLYAVVVRLAARAADFDRVWEIMRRMAAPLRLFSKPGGNELMPTPNDDYEHFVHVSDFLQRRSRRCGMILNQSELVSFIRFPSAAVRSPQFLRVDLGTRAAAPSQPTTHGVCLGSNRHVGKTAGVWLDTEQRLRHMHVIGASGGGKTSLFFNMLRQDIASGNGFALLDPHGDLVDRVLAIIPPERHDDVILLDPADDQFIVPFNFLSAHSELEKTLLASDLVGIFRDQSTSWGDQMNSVFGGASGIGGG